MSWQDRLGEAIRLISPSGEEFEAAWRGNARSKEKTLGVFKYPRLRGEVVQDLDVGGNKHPITVIFEGPDHDLQAEAFYAACSERGKWTVEHPVRGRLFLQLVSVTEEIQPVTSANMTELATDWIEPAQPGFVIVSATQRASQVKQQAITARNTSADDFAARVATDKPALITKLQADMQKLKVLTDKLNAEFTRLMALRAEALSIANAAVSNVVSFGSAVQAFISLPGDLITDAAARFEYYKQILTVAVQLDPTVPDLAGLNSAALHEIVAVTCLSGMAEAVVAADFTTRTEALAYLADINTAFIDATNTLDTVQVLYAGQRLERRFFSQSTSFTDTVQLIRLTSELLLRRSFDLAASRSFTLRKDRAPIEIAITEGVDLDAFIAANRLTAEEILLLPTGRKVVVYL